MWNHDLKARRWPDLEVEESRFYSDGLCEGWGRRGSRAWRRCRELDGGGVRDGVQIDFWSYSRLKGSEGEKQSLTINAILNRSQWSCWWTGVMRSTREREFWASRSSWRRSRPEGKESHRSIRDVIREWMIMELFGVRRLIFCRWKRADGVTLLTRASGDTTPSMMKPTFHTRGRKSTGVINMQRKTICFITVQFETVSGEQGFNFQRKRDGGEWKSVWWAGKLIREFGRDLLNLESVARWLLLLFCGKQIKTDWLIKLCILKCINCIISLTWVVKTCACVSLAVGLSASSGAVSLRL